MVTLTQVREDPIFQALDPKGKKFMRACAVPEPLNPFAQYGIEMFALIPFGVFPHIKTIPAFQMMLEDFEKGVYEGKHTIVVPSSGNTVHGVARLARAFGFTKVKAVMATDVTESKTGILKAFGTLVDVLQVGNVLETTKELEQMPGHYHLNQYGHMGNARAHAMYTGPEIVRVLGEKVSVVAAAMGSSGTAAGIGKFFRARGMDTTVLGVRPARGEQVPGARDERAMAEVVRIPWHETVDDFVEVGRRESFYRMRQLWTVMEPQPGPTSGMAWGGLEQRLKTFKPDDLERMRDTCVAFICPDDGRFYPERTTAVLDPPEGAG